MIAILGTGLLGSGFARALRKKGETVHVWNRTFARAKALEAEGCVALSDAAEAVKGASRVHVVVSDDAAVDSVLELAKLPSGARVYDHTTTSTAGARASEPLRASASATEPAPSARRASSSRC